MQCAYECGKCFFWKKSTRFVIINYEYTQYRFEKKFEDKCEIEMFLSLICILK